jgi:hypothetical protein
LISRRIGSRGGDRAAQAVVRILPAVDRDDGRAGSGADVEQRRIPGDAADPSALADHRPDREGEIEILAVAFARSPIGRRRVAIDEVVAAGLDPGERGVRLDLVDPLAQECGPIEGRDSVESARDIVKRIGGDALIAGIDAEKGVREIVHRALAARELAQLRIDLEPDQHAFRIIILAAHIAGPGLRPPALDDRIVGGVDQRPPRAAREGVVISRGPRQLGAHVLDRHQPRASGKHIAPELGLAFVDPEQAVAHRHVVGRRPQVGRAAVFAVPAVGRFVGQEVAAGRALRPAGEIVAALAVFGRAQMLEPDPAELVAEREQEFIMVEMLGAVEPQFLLDQAAVDGDLLGRGGEVAGIVGEDVERDIVAEILAPVITPREHRRIDQSLIRNGAVAGPIVLPAGDFERGRRRPAGRVADVGLDHDVAGEMAGRVERHLLPLQVEEIGRHRDPALAAVGRRQMEEFDPQLMDAGGDVDVEGVDITRVADPGDIAGAGRDADSGERVDRTARPVIAGQPLRKEEGERPRPRDRNGLDHPIDAAPRVAGVDVEPQGAGIGNVARRRRRFGHRQRFGAGGADLGGGGKGERERRRGKEEEAHRETTPRNSRGRRFLKG